MENNDIVRVLAHEYELPVVDCAVQLSRIDYLVDWCHFNEKGQKARARLIYQHIAPLLE